MGQYTSYWLYQKYEKRGDQDWLPTYPNVWSVDGDGSMSLIKRMDNDPACGYDPHPEVQYRWVNIDPSVDYYCEECSVDPSVKIYRWNKATATDYACSGTTKMYKEYYQYSTDGGVTWQNVIPVSSRTSDTVIEYNSEDCGYIPPTYRWVKSNETICVSDTPGPTPQEPQYRLLTTATTCANYNLYILREYQKSDDGGITWSTIGTTTGPLIENDSEQCGYPPIVPTDGKWKATYADSHTASAECDASSAITNGEITKENLVSVEIGDCVTSISDSAFSGCTSITSVSMSDGVTSIGNSAFRSCSGLITCRLSRHVTTIGDSAFNGCSGLTNIIIPNEVTSIGNWAFFYCNGLTSVTIGNSVTTIGDSAFNGCSGLTSVTIGNSVTTIGETAFNRCTSLTNIVIPISVRTIRNGAFNGCSGLTSITVNATTPPSLGDNAFDSTNNCPIYVPWQKVSYYKEATGWNTYKSRIKGMP